MQLIETVTVGAGGASSITFSSIPQEGFTDLLIVISGRSNKSGPIEGTKLFYNGSDSQLTARDLIVTVPPAVGSDPFNFGRAGVIPGNTATANTYGSMSIYIPNYRSSANKSYSVDSVIEHNFTGSYFSNIVAGLWSNTAAITSVTIQPSDGPNAWMQYSSASLYGILAGSDGSVSVS